MFSLISAFFWISGKKRKPIGLTNSEYAKEFVRISALEDKLYL